MNPERFNELLKVREEFENMCRGLAMKHQEFPSILYIVSLLNGRVEIHVEQINEYLENITTKRTLLYTTHNHCYSLIDKGHQILGVGCILDVLTTSQICEKGLSENEKEELLKKHLIDNPIATDPTAKDTLYSTLCTHEGPIVRLQHYYKDKNPVKFGPLIDDQDGSTHKGIFIKLYPPPRTSRNTVKIMIIDVCLYDPQFTEPGPMLIGHQIIMNDLRRSIWKEKAAGRKIILAQLPDHSGHRMCFDKRLFDGVAVFTEQPKNREMFLLQIRMYCYLKHDWNLEGDIKMSLAKSHHHL